MTWFTHWVRQWKKHQLWCSPLTSFDDVAVLKRYITATLFCSWIKPTEFFSQCVPFIILECFLLSSDECLLGRREVIRFASSKKSIRNFPILFWRIKMFVNNTVNAIKAEKHSGCKFMQHWFSAFSYDWVFTGRNELNVCLTKISVGYLTASPVWNMQYYDSSTIKLTV